MSAPKPPLKITITLSVESNAWFDYRQACHERNIRPSHEIEAFMRQQLAAWQQQTQKETDHA